MANCPTPNAEVAGAEAGLLDADNGVVLTVLLSVVPQLDRHPIVEARVPRRSSAGSRCSAEIVSAVTTALRPLCNHLFRLGS